MAQTWKVLKFRLLGPEKMREKLIVDYCFLYDEFHPAEVILKSILDEEARFVRTLDGTETEFLAKQYTLLEEMKRNR